MGDGPEPGAELVSLILFLRGAGLSLIVLALLHAVFWRALNWGREVERLSPLNALVFAVHTFFISFVLFALGLLSLVWPELLLGRSELGRLLLLCIVIFWVVRLLLQPLLFDRVMREGWTRSLLVRIGATLLWSAYVAVYGRLLIHQFGND